MSKKKATATNGATAAPIVSKMAPGQGGQRTSNRLICIYAPAKTGKTTAASFLRAKWIVSDPNALPTLAALKSMPAASDIYEVDSLAAARAVTADALAVAAEHGAASLGVEAFVVDSLTQFAEWHQDEIANQTSQRFLGDNQKNNGWQQFNAEFGRFLDDLVRLSRFVNVVVICHANQKADPGKGQWAGISLTPKMAERVGRTANWLLFMTARELTEEVAKEYGEDDPFITVMESRAGKKRYTERILHTQPVDGGWHAAASGVNLKPEEAPNLKLLLQKEGLLGS